ncbi:MAG: hypothetical protein WED33_06215 [Bacteroidia bacterium]
MKIIQTLVLVALCSIGHAQLDKVALISVFGDRNLSDSPLETKIYEALMKDSSFNLVPIVNKFDVTIRETFLPQFPFPFLDKSEVVDADGYPEIKELTRWAKNDWSTTPADKYVSIAAYGIADDNDAIAKSFEILGDEIDGVMIAYINFNIYDAGGVGPLAKKKVYAYVNIKIFDRQGNRIFKLKERASSDKGVLSVSGIITDLDKVLPMIESASNNLLEDMVKKLPKSLNKMAKKIEKNKKVD